MPPRPHPKLFKKILRAPPKFFLKRRSLPKASKKYPVRGVEGRGFMGTLGSCKFPPPELGWK